MGAAHGRDEPSPWVQRFACLVRPGGRVLDVACGSGRHVRWLAAEGFRITGVDRDAAALVPLAAIAEAVVADIEAGPWPFGGRRFDAVVGTNYLWRPLWPALLASLEPGGVLIWETFARDHATIGRPANPDFLLAPGELLTVAAPMVVVAYEDGHEAARGARGERFVQRIAAVRPPAPGPHPLDR
jgi:SAM-dependent methyltransferase